MFFGIPVDFRLGRFDHRGGAVGPRFLEIGNQPRGLLQPVVVTGDNLAKIERIGRDILRAQREGNRPGHEPVPARQLQASGRRHETLGIDEQGTPDGRSGQRARRLRLNAAHGTIGKVGIVNVVVRIGAQYVHGLRVARQVDAGQPGVVVEGHHFRRMLDAHDDVGTRLLDFRSKIGVNRGPGLHPVLHPPPPGRGRPIDLPGRRTAGFAFVCRHAMVAIAAYVAVGKPDLGLVVQMDFPQRRQPDHSVNQIHVFGLVLGLERAQPPGHHEFVAVKGRTASADAHQAAFRVGPQERLPVFHISRKHDDTQAEFLGPFCQPAHLLPDVPLSGEFVVVGFQPQTDVRKPLLADPFDVVPGKARLFKVQHRRSSYGPFHPAPLQ